MDYREFARKIKTKYPDYSDMDDRELAQKMVNKYPSEYSDVTFGDQQTYPNPSVGLMDAFSVANELAPWNRLRQKTIEPLGQAVAEVGGRMGYPISGAAVGTAIQTAPEILSAAEGLIGMRTSQVPFWKAVREKPRMIGRQMEAGEIRAGLDPKQLPEQRGSMPRFYGSTERVPYAAPKSYPKDTKTLVNFARKRMLKFGDKLSAQEIKDYRSLLSDAIGELESKGMAGKPTHAIASDVRTMANDLYNKVVEGRGPLNEAYRYSKVMHPDWQQILMNQLRRLKRKYL